ncbi:hypothetical protein [Paenibacillus periandrae]|uniref:hypothetical protein n=1 Tax=Paenibacillus periandrae TaxID=1761741 RepID=UPI001F098888|nr:hypothetical protein [Paenibacillus periandrae]
MTMSNNKGNPADDEIETVPELVTCQADGCINGYVEGEKCDTCWGTSLVSQGQPGSDSYTDVHVSHETSIFGSSIKVKAFGEDHWGRKLYTNIESKRVYALVDDWYYTITGDGEPECPLKRQLIIQIVE